MNEYVECVNMLKKFGNSREEIRKELMDFDSENPFDVLLYFALDTVSTILSDIIESKIKMDKDDHYKFRKGVIEGNHQKIMEALDFLEKSREDTKDVCVLTSFISEKDADRRMFKVINELKDCFETKENSFPPIHKPSFELFTMSDEDYAEYGRLRNLCIVNPFMFFIRENFIDMTKVINQTANEASFFITPEAYIYYKNLIEDYNLDDKKIRYMMKFHEIIDHSEDDKRPYRRNPNYVIWKIMMRDKLKKFIRECGYFEDEEPINNTMFILFMTQMMGIFREENTSYSKEYSDRLQQYFDENTKVNVTGVNGVYIEIFDKLNEDFNLYIHLVTNLAKSSEDIRYLITV